MNHKIVWQTQDERMTLLEAAKLYADDYYEPLDKIRTIVVYVRNVHALNKIMEYRR